VDHESCAGGKCNKKLGQVAGKVEYQNKYFITTDYVTGNGEDFKKGVGALA